MRKLKQEEENWRQKIGRNENCKVLERGDQTYLRGGGNAISFLHLSLRSFGLLYYVCTHYYLCHVSLIPSESKRRYATPIGEPGVLRVWTITSWDTRHTENEEGPRLQRTSLMAYVDTSLDETCI